MQQLPPSPSRTASRARCVASSTLFPFRPLFSSCLQLGPAHSIPSLSSLGCNFNTDTGEYVKALGARTHAPTYPRTRHWHPRDGFCTSRASCRNANEDKRHRHVSPARNEIARGHAWRSRKSGKYPGLFANGRLNSSIRDSAPPANISWRGRCVRSMRRRALSV